MKVEYLIPPPPKFMPISITIGSAEELVVQSKRPSILVTQTPEFRAWFRGSHVVVPKTSSRDKSPAKPLIVYHGTRNSFDAFEVGREGTNSGTFGSWKTRRAGIFFAEDPEFAGLFAEQGERPTGSNVMPVYLSIKNPIYLDNGFDNEAIEKLKAQGVSESWMFRMRADDMWEIFDEENGGFDTVAAMKRAGYDGAFITEPGESGPQNVWVAFEPTQIKSAVGNNGAFSPKRPSILEP